MDDIADSVWDRFQYGGSQVSYDFRRANNISYTDYDWRSIIELQRGHRKTLMQDIDVERPYLELPHATFPELNG